MARKTNDQKEFEEFFKANAPDFALRDTGKYLWNHRYKNGTYSFAYVRIGFMCWMGSKEKNYQI